MDPFNNSAMSRLLPAADTIEQLAEYIGVEPAALSATVEQYNKVCTEGCDIDFCQGPALPECSCKGSLLRPCHHPEVWALHW